MEHKAGFVTIIGKPNVGKSTLMNSLIGNDLSIVTPKAQTTRHRIKGIANGDDYQIVFSDTPGILKPAYKLHEKMLHAVDESFQDVDIVLFVVEAGEKKLETDIEEKIKKSSAPLFIVINKIDTSEQAALEEAINFWENGLHPKEIIPVSAKENFGVDVLLSKLVSYLPESPPYYNKEDLSDRNTRFFVSEIIREKILMNYGKEIPYSCQVSVNEYKETKTIDRIFCEIYVVRESQKAILLGHKGEAIKKLGTLSREKIEKLVGKKVYLELTVKVKDDWRNNDNLLNKFGY